MKELDLEVLTIGEIAPLIRKKTNFSTRTHQALS